MDAGEELTLDQVPDEWWRWQISAQTLSGWFKQHTLGLFLAAKVGNEIKPDVFTGFLLEYKQNLLWITVGHGVKELHDILLNHRDDIMQLRWMDNCTIPGAETFPVHNRALKLFWSDEIDFGFAHITGLDEANIRKSDQVQILSEHHWRDIDRAKPEGFYIIGYPKEWIEIHKQEANGRTTWSATLNLSCLPIQRVPFKADGGNFWKDPQGFYGKIMPFVEQAGGQPKSPVGMSGAPMISLERGLREDGELGIRYYLFGIQRSWNEVDTIRAEPIQKATAIMEQCFQTLE